MNFIISKELLTYYILSFFKEYRIIKDIPEPKHEKLIISDINQKEIFFSINYNNKRRKYKITWQLYLAESAVLNIMN